MASPESNKRKRVEADGDKGHGGKRHSPQSHTEPRAGSKPSPTLSESSAFSAEALEFVGFSSLKLSETEEDRPSSPQRPCLRKTKPVRYLDEKDPLVRGLGLKFLSEKGHINLLSIPTPDPGFGYGKHATPAVACREFKKTGIKATDGKVTLPVEEDLYIHPIFSREMWETQELASRSLPYWDNLKPVWQLATLMLEEKVMSGFLCGMLDRKSHHEIRAPLAARKSYWFEAKQSPTQEESWNLWDTIWRLQEVVKFGVFENKTDSDRALSGASVPAESSPGLKPSGCGSKILINEDTLSILCSRTKPSDYSTKWIPGTDDASGLLRIRFQLATTLVHELIHSLWYAHFGCTIEPFYRDHRFAELGWTHEAMLYGGAIGPISYRVTMPYGLQIQDWPGQMRVVSYPHLLHYGAQPTKGAEYFPVPMDWLPKFFTQEFWNEVERFGRAAFKCPRPPRSVRIVLKQGSQTK
ncbi:hypothetical protein KCU99_g1652, partial [Aureobasidium melanogenum]